MPSSTSLYSSTPGNANVASQNFTTLYSGSGTINPQQAYGNANVVSLLATSTDGGNTIGNISATGNVTADYFIGNFQGNITGNINVTGANTEVLFNNAGNVGTAAGFTFVNTTGNLAVPGNVSAVGNVAASYFLGNGSQLTGLPATYSNANVTSLLASFGSNVISTTGNITGGFILGNGSQLTGLPATYSNVNVVSLLAAFGSNTISTTGNITAGYFVGNGSALTSITGANVTGVVANATYALNANAATYATNAIQANVANVANSVAGANVTGTVGLAQYVTQAAQANITSVGTLSSLSVSGNVTSGNILSNGIVSAAGDIQTPGNISQTGFSGKITALGNIDTSTGMSAGGNVTGGNIRTAGQVSATGNITGNFFIGNGSQLTGIVSSYGNANVAANLAAFATNPISTSGNITAGYFFGNGSGLTDINAGNIIGAYGNANVANFLGNGFGSNTITTTGNITSGNSTVTNTLYVSNIEGAAGQTVTITAEGTGDIHLDADSIRIGDNNTAATIVTHGTGNLILRTHEGSAVEGNITVVNGVNGNIQLNPNGTGVVTTTAVSATGNVNGGNVIVPINGKYYGDFTTGTTAGRTVFQTTATGTSAATSLTAVPGPNHITSNTAFSSQINLFANGTDLGNSSFGRMQMFGNRLNFEATAAGTGAIGNMRFAAGSAQIVLLNTGNVGIGNANPNHAFSTNESYIAGNISVTANVIGSNVNTVGEVTATGNVIGGNINTGGIVTATGNITGANLVASANLTSTQQTVVGTANVGTTGNIVVSGRNLATDMAYSPDGATGTTQYLGRVMVGTGWAGNIAVGQPSRLSTMDMINRGNTATSLRQLESDSIVNLTANVSNSSFRQQAFGARLRVGGGSAGNSTVFGSGVGIPFTIAAAQLNLDIGNQSPYLLGNTSVSHAALNSGALSLNAGSSIGNAYGYVPFVNSAGSGGTANITNYIGMASSFASANVTGNLFCFYNGNATSVGSYSVQTSNNARAATNYYFLRNDDNVAQVQLGSLRSYNEFQYATATSGTVNIDKNNAQVQYIAPTANVTIGSLQNFVTNANDSVNNDAQTDTVTLIIKQGATPYTVSMPTGNASIKYAGGISTIGTTANAVTMVSITGANVAGAALYLVTVSPEFS